MNRRSVGLAAVWAAFLVLVGSSLASAATEAKLAPEFTLPDLAGEDVSLSERLKEGPVIVDFWATWCKPCIKAFPDLQEIFDNYKDCGLSVFAISIDGPRSTSRVGALIKSKGNTFEVLLDPAQKVAKKFHVTSVPRTVLINTDGTIAWAVTGYRPSNHEELGKAVALLFPEGCDEKVEGAGSTGGAAATEGAGE
jgi:cytochrome c biogenesis protein CcmG/thiol:disulfide interchange protein DsbE